MRLQTPGISRDADETFLRSDGKPRITSPLDERAVVRGNHESWLVSTRSHPIREPNERVHVSLASEGDEEDSKRHGSRWGARGQIPPDQP
jgi:hypothetical protein